MATCFHCDLPAAEGFEARIDGQTQSFCCAGCQAIAITITDGGLGQFYQYRQAANTKAESSDIDDVEVYDLAQIQSDFVRVEDGRSIASLLIEGISCAACVWLIEKHLTLLPGIQKVSVNAASHHANIEFDPAQLPVSQIFKSLKTIGFSAKAHSEHESEQYWAERQKSALIRLGLAGIGMMQAGMVSVALHAGSLQGITEDMQSLLRWASLILATPVLMYCALPFYRATLRAIKTRHLVMDVPVALALSLAYLASAYATFSGHGEVYFDSIAMFTFFLLLGRYLEQRIRFKNFISIGALQKVLPITCKVSDGARKVTDLKTIPMRMLKVGDYVWVPAGEVFPCDGTVLEGHSSADESLLTGEANPVEKCAGLSVVAGSHNIDSGIWVEATACGSDTALAKIEALSLSAENSRPKRLAIADKVAGYFVACVLVVATAVAGVWLWVDSSKALWVTLSVLVVTCPCALSLAAPTALTAALNFLRTKGLLATSAEALDALNSVTDIVFDKTGTLTEGMLEVADVRMISGQLNVSSPEQVLAIVGGLQRTSNHPIAQAFTAFDEPSLVVDCSKSVTGAGVEGLVGDKLYRFGRAKYCMPTGEIEYPSAGLWLLLTCEDAPVAWVLLRDRLREEAIEAIQSLIASHKHIHILSGDREENVAPLAKQLAIPTTASSQSPEQKLQYVRKLQEAGRCVLMVGDGINDVPVLGSADVSVAMGKASRLAKSRADVVLLAEDLRLLSTLLSTSRRVDAVIRQNLAWALCYNLCALPAAAAGLVPPWAAAIGMSASSLVVLLNAMRLQSISSV